VCSIHHQLFTESVRDCVGIANDHTISVAICIYVCISNRVTVCVTIPVGLNNGFIDANVVAIGNTRVVTDEFTDANYRSVAGIRSLSFANHRGDAGCAHRITRHNT